MASTIAFYTGDGTTTDFTVPFDYLAKKFVRVSLGSRVLQGGDYGDTSKDYYFLDKTKVRLKVPPQEGEVLTIRRYTSATDRVVSFKDASVLKATDLDVSSVQTIHIAEEGRDIINDALIKDKKGNWDAKGNRITNVGTPEADSDAVAYGVYKADAMGAYQAKLDADAARDAAKVSEVSASDSASLAKDWATKTTGTVDGSEYSAKYYANETKEQVSLAIQQATIATTKASEAKDSANSAGSSADTATTQATNASNSAKEAKISEDNAALSKTAAGTSATNAKASETEAKRQADLAKDYANQATSGQVNSDWAETDSTSKAFIKNKPTLGALASKNSIAYSEITGTPPEQDLSGLATKNELQTGLAGKANSSHTHTKAQITDFPSIPDAILKNGNRGAIAGYEHWTNVGNTITLNVSSGDTVRMDPNGKAATITLERCSVGQVATKLVWVFNSNGSITINGSVDWFGSTVPTLNKATAALLFVFHDGYTDCRLIGQWG